MVQPQGAVSRRPSPTLSTHQKRVARTASREAIYRFLLKHGDAITREGAR